MGFRRTLDIASDLLTIEYDVGNKKKPVSLAPVRFLGPDFDDPAYRPPTNELTVAFMRLQNGKPVSEEFQRKYFGETAGARARTVPPRRVRSRPRARAPAGRSNREPQEPSMRARAAL